MDISNELRGLVIDCSVDLSKAKVKNETYTKDSVGIDVKDVGVFKFEQTGNGGVIVSSPVKKAQLRVALSERSLDSIVSWIQKQIQK